MRRVTDDEIRRALIGLSRVVGRAEMSRMARWLLLGARTVSQCAADPHLRASILRGIEAATKEARKEKR